jgi:hypothetical protein
MGTTATPAITKGAFVEIDHAKLDPDGFKLIGGVEALTAAAMMVEALRAKSTVAQERVFLSEIAALLRQIVTQTHDRLAAHAMSCGAGTLHEIPEGAKAN